MGRQELPPDQRMGDGRSLREHIMEDKMWYDIRREAVTNPALQDALERVIIIYELTRTHQNES